MSSQKLESLLQTYTFFLCPVKHQDPPSIPARHPEIFPAKVTSPPLSVFLPLSYFSPHPLCIHTLSVHLPIHIPIHIYPQFHTISFQLSWQWNSISLKLTSPFSLSLYLYRSEAFKDLMYLPITLLQNVRIPDLLQNNFLLGDHPASIKTDTDNK